jgi:ketosteroid isomerase-like protein
MTATNMRARTIFARMNATMAPGYDPMRSYLQRFTLNRFLMLGVMVAIISCAALGTHAAHAASNASAHQAHEAYVAAINSNNLKLFMAMVTDDVVFLSPNEPVVVGKAAIRRWATEYLNAFSIHWDKAVDEFTIAGDWAFERYSYKQNDQPKSGGASVKDTGKGIIIYHHDMDGKWRVARDAWNSDLAVPAK